MPRGPASAVGIYRRCANDDRARDTEESRERDRERKLIGTRNGEKENRELERKREKVSRGLSVTRGVERRVTQVRSSAPACPRAITAQQRQEVAEHQWLQQRQVGWNNKQDSQRKRNSKQEEKQHVLNKFTLNIKRHSIKNS